MYLLLHGGQCCGIKHIAGLGYFPYSRLDPLPKGFIAYERSAPSETYVERLDRYLQFLADENPGGIAEVVLADVEGDGKGQLTSWPPILEERGFREVNCCFNSNSGNMIYVFHKNFRED